MWMCVSAFKIIQKEEQKVPKIDGFEHARVM